LKFTANADLAAISAAIRRNCRRKQLCSAAAYINVAAIARFAIRTIGS